MASAEFDREANALYIRIGEGEVARTVDVDDYRIVDIDAGGAVLGVEVLYPADNLQIAALARQFGFAHLLDDIDEAIVDAMGGIAGTKTVTATIAYVYPGLVVQTVGQSYPSVGTSAVYETIRETVPA